MIVDVDLQGLYIQDGWLLPRHWKPAISGALPLSVNMALVSAP